ncbi:GNAT family N-acetyltransferase [Mycobacterium sp. 21AC1]|uniref:GNAT family N-acetyltransferase n=1 Tax=[Mycobacterium] appelbergii TaxID=2939269 RepID=UPI00293926FB|nr:GNAT family N-acetyltransferase [Mycobacterium sp. 21AC1]MDV3124831.1 GNAT family N-acetyltransferase [Mycobacterium sp. 21AC1]
MTAPPNPQVARLTDADWRVFSTVRLRALWDSLGSDDPQYLRESAFTSAQWRRRLREQAQFAAIVDGAAVGLIGAQQENPQTVYLYSLWLDPGARGRGLAHGLITAAVEWATTRRAHTVRLRVAADNTVARAIYESVGFTITNSETAAAHGELAMTLTVS